MDKSIICRKALISFLPFGVCLPRFVCFMTLAKTSCDSSPSYGIPDFQGHTLISLHHGCWLYTSSTNFKQLAEVFEFPEWSTA